MTSADVSACGDKFLVIARGTRFQRASVARVSASILLYANPTSNMPKALANVPVESVLRKAGYQPTTVMSKSEFESALGRGGWDLIVLDLAEGPQMISRVRDASPAVLSVAYNITGGDLADARKRYQHVLKSPTRSQSFLDAVDEALAARPKLKDTPKAD